MTYCGEEQRSTGPVISRGMLPRLFALPDYPIGEVSQLFGIEGAQQPRAGADIEEQAARLNRLNSPGEAGLGQFIFANVTARAHFERLAHHVLLGMGAEDDDGGVGMA